MKVLSLGKEKHVKLCNVKCGMLVKLVDSNLEISDAYYLVLNKLKSDVSSNTTLVNVLDGTLLSVYSSYKCIVFQNAYIIVNPSEN